MPFTVILVGLDKIQEHIENPFDQVGEDDVCVNTEKFVLNLEAAAGSAGSEQKAVGF